MTASPQSHPPFAGYSEQPQPFAAYATLTAAFGAARLKRRA